MFKIICTGNPNIAGIAQEIQKIFPDTTFVSRTTGYDLSTTEGIKNLKKIIPNYNVFINNSYVGLGVQETILRNVRDLWTTGYVFNIGSLIEYDKFGYHNITRYREKNQLKSLGIEYTDENFKVTHITVGGFKSGVKPRSVDNMDPKYIVDAINWILNAPFQVPVIGIQQMSDQIREYYNLKRKDII